MGKRLADTLELLQSCTRKWNVENFRQMLYDYEGERESELINRLAVAAVKNNLPYCVPIPMGMSRISGR